MRAADDFAAIRARMEELQLERGELKQRAPRNWREYDLDYVVPKHVDEVKRMIARRQVLGC